MANKPGANSCQGKDTFERMNFLYQAGTLMSRTNPTLSCYYGKLCRSVAKKAVLRMEPAVKRTICKRCGYILLAGSSASMCMDAVNPKLCELTCGQCGFVRRFTVNAKYSSWLDDPLAVKERLEIDYRRLPARPATNGQKQPPKQLGNRKNRADRAASGSETINVIVSPIREPSNPVLGQKEASTAT